MFPRFLAIIVLAVLAIAPAMARADEKPKLNGVALVIGQSEYAHISPLPNPANDARDILKLLTDLGFDARSVSDRDAKKLSRDLERFVEDAEGADVAFLYYSGHGIEAGGENWLVPVDADLSSLNDANERLVPVSKVIDELKAIVPVSIVLLDACRTNPFPADAVVRQTPTGSGAPISADGLTPVRGAQALNASASAADNLGMVIGFAAEPGRPALDGEAGKNSPYATALLRHLGALEGAEFGSVMRMVTEEVYLDTQAQQRPWVNESLRRFLYFGVPVEQPRGEDGEIVGERRQLLLTISTLPEASRAEVVTVAKKGDVPMDSLFGVLHALGEDNIPEEPGALEKMLDTQAERIKRLISERDSLRTDDPQIARLSDAADRAIRQGALVAARRFMDQAVAVVETNAGGVDDVEQMIKEKRIADAAVYAKRAGASALAFDYLSAANDYAKAFDLIERWDEKLRWNYKNMEAEALLAAGDAKGDRALLDRALGAYEQILDFIPRGSDNADWAITRNNMAIVYQTIGERESDPKTLLQAIEIFRESMAFFEKANDNVNLAAAETNIGNSLLTLGQREGSPARLEAAVSAFRGALEKRDRTKVPLDWASSQNNLGIALFSLADRTGSTPQLVEAEFAYQLALQEYTREAAPLQWAMTQNNLGNTLNALGMARNDPALLEKASAAFRAALEVRNRENFPLLYGGSQLNLGNSLQHLGNLDGNVSKMEAAASAYREALTVLTRDKVPMDWASAQHNLSVTLQTIGQRTADFDKLEESAAATVAAMQEFTKDKLPLDWAMAQNTLGNTRQLQGVIKNDPQLLKDAVAAFRSALEVYSRTDNPKLWAFVQTGIGSAMQSLSRFDTTTDSLKQSIEARRAALEILTIDNAPLEWATAQNGLGTCLLNLSNFERDDKLLADARAAFEEAAKVFRRDVQPSQWAFTVNNIGDIHWSLAMRGGGEKDFLVAIELFEQAKEGFTEAGQPAMSTLLDQKIALIRQSLTK